MNKRRINVGKDISRRLREEFGVSRATVYNALNYQVGSQLSSEIRKRAKVLLEAQMKQVSALMEEEAVVSDQLSVVSGQYLNTSVFQLKTQH